MACEPGDLVRKAARIRLLLFDVDGVLTDGRILLHGDGSESKQFNIRDGTGHRVGAARRLAVGLLSARRSAATAARAAQLGIRIVRQQARRQARHATRNCCAGARSTTTPWRSWATTCWTCRCSRRVGLSAAPADAAPEVRRTRRLGEPPTPGGDGAVRELVELILRAQGRWDGLLREYLAEATR